MICNRMRRLTNDIVNLDRGKINNFLRIFFKPQNCSHMIFGTITYAPPKIFFTPFGEK